MDHIALPEVEILHPHFRFFAGDQPKTEFLDDGRPPLRHAAVVQVEYVRRAVFRLMQHVKPFRQSHFPSFNKKATNRFRPRLESSAFVAC
jgi:hypothetical protein